MVSLMGARFSKPLIANQVTHLICYKFEGEKYELAKKVNIKLVNHRWLEDCLNVWEILPTDSYTKSTGKLKMHHSRPRIRFRDRLDLLSTSGWELEVLDAEAMDSEEETEDASMKASIPRCVGKPHDSGEVSVTITSGALMDPVNITLQGNIAANKPSERIEVSSVISKLVSTPCKDSSGEVTDMCNTKSKVPRDSYQDCNASEQPPDVHGMMNDIKSKQSHVSDSSIVRMESQKFPLRLGMTSGDMASKLNSVSYSRTLEKVVLPEEHPNNVCTSKLRKSEENIKANACTTFSGSKYDASRNCRLNNLSTPSTTSTSHVEGQAQPLPQKRKHSASSIGSRLLMSVQNSRNTCNAQLNSLKVPDCVITHNEATAKTLCMDEHNNESLDNLKLSDSSTYQKSAANVKEISKTRTKQSPSTSIMPEQSRSFVTPDSEIRDGKTYTEDIEETDFMNSGSNQYSNSLSYKRKSLKLQHSAAVANISCNASLASDGKRIELLTDAPPLTELEWLKSSNLDPVSVRYVRSISSPEGAGLSGIPLTNELGEPVNPDNLIDNGISFHENDKLSVKELEASLTDRRRSENIIAKKSKPDLHSEESERHDKPAEDQEASSSKLRGPRAIISTSTDIHGTDKECKANEGSSRRSRKLLVRRNLSCRPKTSTENFDDRNNSSDSHLSNPSNKMEKSGNSIPKSEVKNIGNKKIGVTELKQPYQLNGISKNINEDENSLDSEKENMPRKCKYEVHKKSKKSVFDYSNSLIKRDNASPLIPSPVWFILSGHRVQRKEFQMIVRQLRGRLCKDSHQWSYQATHFIVPDTVRRTEKFFAAAAAGRWILKPDYLGASSEAGKFLDEEPFEWHKNGLTADGAISLEAPRKWRTLREKTGHGAFYGMRIIIYGDCFAPSLDTLKRVVKAGDGIILATSPPYTRFLNSDITYAVVSAGMPRVDAWVQEFLRLEIPCILPDYLVEYVCKPGYSLDKHVLFKTNSWADKSFANLQIRLTQVVSDELLHNAVIPDDLTCTVCGSRDRGEVMLVCGDEAGELGCGTGTHIDCCDPPLHAVPDDDWFCPSCSRVEEETPIKKRTKGSLKLK
ncbi:BRCT domain-containing protein [Apostasia shenzhenica]|uniref:BRCT domain-containing protein n=1 Tax=Apostasia shenzhenica TaxID=1088818 RepID=A0A2I0AM95_9ASPA|nr:BRCT domain-containing protein [Apostasia shenzhenica]